MKKSFQEQFQNLKIIIETNVTAIRALLQQSESLSNISRRTQLTNPHTSAQYHT